MAMETITLRLPDTLLRRAQLATRVLQCPVEELLTTTLAFALPNVDDAPPEMWPELTRMTWLSDQALWQIAHGAMPTEHQEHLRDLAQAQRPLAEDEQAALDELRQEYGRVMLRKSRAYALLSLRGGRPLLADL